MDKQPTLNQNKKSQEAPFHNLNQTDSQGIQLLGPKSQLQKLKDNESPMTEIEKEKTCQKAKLSIEQKYKLKQQSRELLLKQCYKMAMNKYLRLIREGSEGFSQREWSVIHLNAGIALQYQDRLVQSLEKISEAIKIDKTYQKAYYRRLLILQELGQFQLIMTSDSIVPYFIKNLQVTKLREQICERYQKSIGFDYLINRIQSMNFNNITNDEGAKFIRLSRDIHKSAFLRISQQIESKCKKTEKVKDYSLASEIGQKIGKCYKILKQKQLAIPSKIISQILQSFYQQIYGLSIKYLHLEFDQKDTKKIECLIRFMLAFWRISDELAMEKQQQIFECLDNSTREYVIMYCPYALFNIEHLVLMIKGLLERINKGETAEIEKLYIKLIKMIENNSLIVQICNEKEIEGRVIQFESLSSLTNLIKNCISQVFHSNSTQILQDYKKKTILSDALLNLYQCLKKMNRSNSQQQSYPYRNQKEKQFVELYLARHDLKMIGGQQKNKQMSLLLEKAYKFIIKQKNNQILQISFNKIYTVYETLQRLQPQIYKHQANKSNQQFTESIQQLSNYFNGIVSFEENISSLTIALSNSHNFNNFEILIKWLLSLSILGQLNPTFCMKKMETYRCKIGANMNSFNNDMNNSLGDLLQKLSNVQNILLWICERGGKQTIAKQILKIYVEVLTLLSISNPIFLNEILKSPSTISKIFAVIYPNKKSAAVKSTNSWEPSSLSHQMSEEMNLLQIQALPPFIKLLYTLLVDVSQQQQEQFAERMGVEKEQIKKAKKLQGQNKYPDVIESINKRRIVLKLVMTGKQEAMSGGNKKVDNKGEFVNQIQNIWIDYNTWSEVIHQIIHMLNSVQVEQYQIEDKMMVGIILNLAECEPKKFHSLEIINWMLLRFNKYHPLCSLSKNKLPSTSPYLKIGYQIAKYFSKIIKKINVSTLTYVQLQPIANILIYLIENAKHELEIFESFLSLINLSSKNISIPLEIIYLGCTENNQYIVHGALQLFNNILVNTEFENKIQKVEEDREKVKYWSKFKQVEELVYKYYKYYKNLIDEQTKSKSVAANTNDYSHPYKIYCTLLSVLLVLRSLTISFKEQNVTSVYKPECPEIGEFASWKQAFTYLHLIETNKGDISITLFKLVLNHVENGTLTTGWHIGLEKALRQLKDTDLDKWIKLQKYVK